ncbi:receptor-transporting protein 3-like [Chanos chanos]|uniref:Receptor-transporting protein 3-like n=1 Tax=Chanos chanos TaxID=29144 RepID=A0A6J2WSA2_CHACN|nr:receptor-transporting protein 3-like [Chanos chanos]
MTLKQWIDIFDKKSKQLQHFWSIEFDDSIQADQPAAGWEKYIRGAFASFRCSKCRRSWPSKRVLVAFHMRLDKSQRKGTVKVRRFRQDCKSCNQPEMEEPSFSEKNVEVLIDKLIEKIRIKCYKQKTGRKPRAFYSDHDPEGPHEKAHCEACKSGICRRGN